MNPADICRECELPSKARELEEVIGELIDAVNDLSVCSDCHEDSGEFLC